MSEATQRGDVVGAPDASEVTVVVRRARTSDVDAIRRLVQVYAERRILLAKDSVAYYESVQQFRVAEIDGVVVGCGALHVFWEDVAEVRTLAVAEEAAGHGIGGRLVTALLTDARDLGVSRVFCLTFEVDFFARYGFRVIEGAPVTHEVFAELVRSYDAGTAEFLDLDRVKPNTLGNTRMLVDL